MQTQTQVNKNQAIIDRLADAITFHRENTPVYVDRPYIAKLAIRFSVHPKVMERAIEMLVQGEWK